MVFGGIFPVRMSSSLNSSTKIVVELDLVFQYLVVGNITSPLTRVLVCSSFERISDFFVYQISLRISGNPLSFSDGNSGHSDGNTVSVLRWSSIILVHVKYVPICQ